MSLSTGVVPFDFATVSSEGIDSYGNAKDIEGPGYLTFEGDKLAVKGPDNYVWGYSAPSKVLTKTSSGVNLVEDGKVLKSIPANEIKNLNFSSEYFNNDTIVSWYNYDAQEGDNFTLEKGMVGFSDGRNDINASMVPVIFGQDVVDYSNEYPTGSPILLYSGNYTEQAGQTAGTTFDSHPEYGDALRKLMQDSSLKHGMELLYHLILLPAVKIISTSNLQMMLQHLEEVQHMEYALLLEL